MSHIKLLSALKATPTFGSLTPPKDTSILLSQRNTTIEDYAYRISTPYNLRTDPKARLYFNTFIINESKEYKADPTYINCVDTARVFLNIKPNNRIGRAYIRLIERHNNVSVIVRSPSGKTLGSWRGGYFKYSRNSPNVLRIIVEKVEKCLKDNYIAELSIQYGGTKSNLFFKLAKKLRNKYKVRTLSFINPIPHGGPRPKRLRRV
jgi:ribosomal protein S11